MKKFLLLMASGLFAAHFAVSAQADDRMGMDKKGDYKTMDGKAAMGMHKMTGTVDNLDSSKGTLTLKTGEGDLMLHFPPASLKDVKNGDTITVKLGFSKGSAMMKK